MLFWLQRSQWLLRWRKRDRKVSWCIVQWDHETRELAVMHACMKSHAVRLPRCRPPPKHWPGTIHSFIAWSHRKSGWLATVEYIQGSGLPIVLCGHSHQTWVSQDAYKKFCNKQYLYVNISIHIELSTTALSWSSVWLQWNLTQCRHMQHRYFIQVNGAMNCDTVLAMRCYHKTYA